MYIFLLLPDKANRLVPGLWNHTSGHVSQTISRPVSGVAIFDPGIYANDIKGFNAEK
jgi:hypothetical protein